MWRNWQTHKTQNLAVVTSCGFKSRHPHSQMPYFQGVSSLPEPKAFNSAFKKHSNIVFVQKGGLQILLIPFFLLFFKSVLKKIQYFPFFLFFSFFQYKLKILFNFVFLVFILLIQSFFLCLTYKYCLICFYALFP